MEILSSRENRTVGSVLRKQSPVWLLVTLSGCVKELKLTQRLNSDTRRKSKEGRRWSENTSTQIGLRSLFLPTHGGIVRVSISAFMRSRHKLWNVLLDGALVFAVLRSLNCKSSTALRHQNLMMDPVWTLNIWSC